MKCLGIVLLAASALLAQIRIDCGGTKPVPDANGGWIPDVYFSGSSAAIAKSPSDPWILNTIRYGSNFTYTIPAVPLLYAVYIRFIEQYATGPGQRVFAVIVDGRTEIAAKDIYAEVGPNVEVVNFIQFYHRDGPITIQFVASVGSARVAAIEIFPYYYTFLVYPFSL